jgi:hypothetical protein
MDIEVILLTSIVVTLFVVFGIAVYREFNIMESTEYTYTKETGPRAGLVNFVGNLASNQSLTKKERQVVYNAMQRNIADMESNGVYFDESIKEIMKKHREELYCEYSGLPSVKSYEQKNERVSVIKRIAR